MTFSPICNNHMTYIKRVTYMYIKVMTTTRQVTGRL